MKKIFTLLFLWAGFVLNAQYSKEIVLNWDGFLEQQLDGSTFKYPYFKDPSFVLDVQSRSISSSSVFEISYFVDPSSLRVDNVVYESINESQLYGLNKSLIQDKIDAKIESVKARASFLGNLKFNPIISSGGIFKKVVSLRVSYQLKGSEQRTSNSIHQIYNSVLATGNWYRFYVGKSGVYKISKSFLQSLGFNTNIDPRNIKIYGNGGRMLPLLNSTPYPEDLEENAIQVIGESDGVFNDDDYILFYAEGVDTWNDESLTSVNLYSDKTFYYVTSNGVPGKRIQSAIEPSNSPDFTFSKYNAEIIHENDLVNVAKLGRRWFGEQFNIENNQVFDFQIPNLDTTTPVGLKVNVASKSLGNSSFEIKANNQTLGTLSILPSAGSFAAFENVFQGSFTASSSTVSIGIAYNNGGVPSSNGYLDFIQLSATCNLKGYNKQFLFFNEQEQNNIGVGEYVISTANSIEEVWDVTDIYNVKKYINNGQSTFAFKVSLGLEKKYVAVDNADYFSPLKETNSVVLNQNLKGTIFLNSQGVFQDIDCLIITPNFLKSQAERLAGFHKSNSGMNTKVVTLESIYQEFSSGKQDVAAIRNFIKYVYFNASTVANRVKYVNLFGDASYDYKNRIPNNSNIVPIFHGFNPNANPVNNGSNMSIFSTFLSDDFYGLMDGSEGTMPVGTMDGIDIAVGRMVVSTVQQASEMVDKVFEYHALESYGRWRNSYVVYSDDADDATDSVLQQWLDDLADELVVQKPFVNVKKIHTDSYVQQVDAGGERYPEAKNDFLDAMQLGALVFNYLGHGNEESLARERLFEKLEAQNLTNKYRYPLFITITCDFTRFDDPGRPSGGEYMFWNNQGGAIGLIATTRQLSFTAANIMNDVFAEELYAYGSFNYPTVAEALRLTKLQTGTDNRRVVSFVGDPALKLAIPKPKVVLTAVNDIPVGQPLPVFQALDLMKIEGQLVDENDNLISDYNGDVAIQIFDKDINRSTLGNNGASNGSGLIIMDFVTLGETIFRGNATVVNGRFEISFVVPQDIRIPLGNGKISFYAKKENAPLEDQTGYDRTIQVGGVNVNAAADTTPPVIQLYMNDSGFVSGGLTNCSPILLVYLEDANGINTASGIGHDIVAILDGDEANPYILNDYYETELDDFTKGKVKFPFRNLEPGMHTLLIKAWDVYNNLVTAEIQFNAICSDEGLRIERVLNYPNPFVNYTEFWFTHNMPFEPLDVQVQILTISGKLVKTINQQVVTDGFLCREVKWDGRDDFGDKIGKGVYVYRLTVKSTTTGNQTQKYEKLVIL